MFQKKINNLYSNLIKNLMDLLLILNNSSKNKKIQLIIIRNE